MIDKTNEFGAGYIYLSGGPLCVWEEEEEEDEQPPWLR